MSHHNYYIGDSLEVLKTLPDKSVHCCVTSPPYWGLRDYGVPGQIGLEPTPEEYVSRLVDVFREVRRVLRDDGTCWVNLGDSYTSGGRKERDPGQSKIHPAYMGDNFKDGLRPDTPSGLKPKDLVGIPWMVAFALRADGWYLRSDIIWCLSGGTKVYARTQKGDAPMTIKDLARLDPSTVKLWNGEKWTQLLGVSKSTRRGDEITLVLRSGERISCTPTHKFPTRRGLLEAKDIVVGDILERCVLPEPDQPKEPAFIGEDAAWLAGLYVAEGSRSGDTIQIAGHAKETERWERLQAIAVAYGGYATRTIDENRMDIRLYGKVLNAVIDELVSGRTAKGKHFSPVVWRYSNRFLEAILDGYLAGNGHYDAKNDRWRLGFTRNYNLESDLRTICARLGYKLKLNLSHVTYNGKRVPTFRGEIRKTRSGHWNEKDPGEIVAIQKARCREVYDLGVADDPHLFALTSGALTHNSKPNSMPESVTDRPTKAHEYIFLLAKSERYYYDADAIKEPVAPSTIDRGKVDFGGKKGREYKPVKGDPNYRAGHEQWGRTFDYRKSCVNGRNKRTVWTVATQPFLEAHFATFPPDLIRPCILAGTSPQACPVCGAPWKRIVETPKFPKELRAKPGDPGVKVGYGNPMVNTTGTGQKMQNWRNENPPQTIGWQPTCTCPGNDGSGKCVVLDPFGGAGTTSLVAKQHGRNSIYIDINPEYTKIAIDRMNFEQGDLFEKHSYEVISMPK